MTTDLYGTSSIKRLRLAGGELEARRYAIHTIFEAIQPCTVVPHRLPGHSVRKCNFFRLGFW